MLPFSFLLSNPVLFFFDSSISALLSTACLPTALIFTAMVLDSVFAVICPMMLLVSSRGQQKQTLAASPDNAELLIWFGGRGDGSLGGSRWGLWPPGLDLSILVPSVVRGLEKWSAQPKAVTHWGEPLRWRTSNFRVSQETTLKSVPVKWYTGNHLR